MPSRKRYQCENDHIPAAFHDVSSHPKVAPPRLGSWKVMPPICGFLDCSRVLADVRQSSRQAIKGDGTKFQSQRLDHEGRRFLPRDPHKILKHQEQGCAAHRRIPYANA
jgi:hypothetical protein